MHAPVPPTAPAADFRSLLRQAFVGSPALAPAATLPAIGALDRPASALPVAEHRREWLFALSASALASAAEGGKPDDLSGLIRERVTSALALAGAVRPAALLDWVRGELFFNLPLDPAEARRLALAVADTLSAAAAAGEVAPDDGWAVIRRGSDRPAGPRDTVCAVGGVTPTILAGQLTLGEQVRRLADLPDPRVAEWLLLSTACGQTAEAIAEWYDVAPAEIASYLQAARECFQTGPASTPVPA